MRKWEKYEYQFPRFSPIQWIWLRNWRGNPCISHMMKYTTGWESNGKKQSYYGKSVGTYFPGFLHSSGFAIFSMIWENDEKTLAFPILWSIPRDRNLMEKTTILWKLHYKPIFQAFHIRGGLPPFPWFGKTMRKPIHFPFDEVYQA